MKRVFVAGLLASALAGSAGAAITVHTSAFVATPIGTNDFEQAGVDFAPINTPYTQGGVTAEYVSSSPSDAGVNILFGTPLDGSKGWLVIDWHGYTSIKRSDGSGFNQIQFLAATNGGIGSPLGYDLLYQGTSLASGFAGTLNGYWLGSSTFGFSGETFDEVRLTNPRSIDGAGDGANDTLVLDNIVLGNQPSPTPEAATWAMMIVGFGAIGSGMRRRKALISFA